MTIKHILIGGFWCLGACFASAQNTSEGLVKTYHFEEAIKALNSEIATLKRKRQNTSYPEILLERARKGQRMLEATEKVTIVDSLVVNKSDFLQYYAISPSEGMVRSYNTYFQTDAEDTDCTVFVNERKTVAYFSKQQEDGTLGLYQSENVEDQWTEPEALQGMSSVEENRNYPFMCSDGITFYYAADGENSLGGYDIFVTRYNATEKAFLKAENVGMPFNSPANDYMLAIDETNQLGWFASDRNQPEDKVCIYIFIPTETRDVYDSSTEDAGKIRHLARIDRIADTWEDMETVNGAKARLVAARQAGSKKDAEDGQTLLVISDSKTYTDITQFQSAEAKQLFLKLNQQKTELQKAEKQLADYRTQYHNASASGKQKLSGVILALEKQVQEGATSIRTLEKEVRNKEIQSTK